jgi:hypothetical protein
MINSSSGSVLLSRALVLLLGLGVWALYYLDGQFAYRMPRGAKRTASQLTCVVGSAGIFALQVQLMEHLAPNDAHGSFFFGLIFIEAGGAIVVLFTTLLREKIRSKRTALETGNSADLPAR